MSRDEWIALFKRGTIRMILDGDLTISEAWECSHIAHWLGLPWRCKWRHQPTRQESWNADACATEQVWIECGRCRDFLGHHPDDPHVRAALRAQTRG